MPAKQIIDDTVWSERLKKAEKRHEEWESRFYCRVLEDYYEGRQWSNDDNPFEQYVINKIYETLQIKLDQFTPEFVKFEVGAAAGNSDYDLELAAASSLLKQDVLNTLISNPNAEFANEVRLAYKDSYFRFGIVEVGYAADWILNPQAPRPLLNKDITKEGYIDKSRQLPKTAKYIPKELPANERIYFKHIEAKRFRVGGLDSRYLARCGWYGYYEFIEKSDLLALPGLLNRDKLESLDSGYTSDDYSFGADDPDAENTSRNSDMFKVWHIWDNKANVQLLVLENPTLTIYQRPIKYTSVFDFRHDQQVKRESFYPVPPVFHWICAQNEINETREQLKKHRRRFNRKFQLKDGGMDDEEVEKFETGDDGTIIKVHQIDALKAIEDPPLGAATDKAFVTSADDMNQISGTSSAVRGKADRTTATEAGIINAKSDIRENAQNDRVVSWLSRIGRCVLITARERFSLGIWAQLTSDPGEQLFSTIQESQPAYQWVSSEELNDGYDFKITIDVTSLSTAEKQKEKQNFIEFLTLITQYPNIALSPILVRETAYRCNYRNEKVIKEMQQMALLQQAGAMKGIGMPVPGGLAQQQGAKMAPDQVEQTRNQLTNQLQ